MHAGTFILKRSRILITGFILLYLSGFLAVIILQASWFVKIALLLMLALVFTQHCRIVCMWSPNSVIGLKLPVNSPWWHIYTRSGVKLKVELKSSQIFQKIIFLSFRRKGSKIPFRVTIPVDAVTTDTHRKLRKYLRKL